MGLLKRNAKDRMNFETFFNHKFLQREPPSAIAQGGIRGLLGLASDFKDAICNLDLPLHIYGSSPLAKVPMKPSTPIRVATPPRSQPGTFESLTSMFVGSWKNCKGILSPVHQKKLCSNFGFKLVFLRYVLQKNTKWLVLF